MLWTDLDRFGLLDTWRVFDRLNRGASADFATSTSEFPAINIWVGGDRNILTVELPGMEPQDIDISVAGKDGHPSRDAQDRRCLRERMRSPV